MSQGRLLVWKSHQNWFWPGMRVARSGVSGNHQGRVNSVSQVNGELRFGHTCACWLGDRKVPQKSNDICQHVCPQRELSCPLPLWALPWSLSIQPFLVCALCFSSCLLLVCCSAKWMSLWVSPFLFGPFKTCRAQVSRSPLSHSATAPWVFTAIWYRKFSPWHCGHGLEIGHGPRIPHSSGGTSSVEMYFLLFNYTTVGMGVAHSAFMPLLPVLTWLFLYILSYRNFVRLVFRWSSMMAVL